MVRPFQVEVRLEGIDAGRIEVDFAGIEMNMGFNRIELTAGAAGLHAGEASLPVCISGQMDWQVTVLVETGRQRIAIPFRFASAPHG